VRGRLHMVAGEVGATSAFGQQLAYHSMII
jgi:hypothetical protein